MRIDFELRPVGAITRWDGARPSLQWFGLTDGWYWLDTGEGQLFRYSDALIAHEEPWRSAPRTLPYVDYYVVRLWEDLIDLLPTILTPVPDLVARKLANAIQWEAWETHLDGWLQNQERNEASDLYRQAIGWWKERHLSTSHLRYGPRIAFWRVGEVMHMRWDNRGLVHNDRPVWSALVGEQAVPVGVFLDALQSFDQRFMAAMADQVNEVREQHLGPDIEIDITQLDREQQDRVRCFERGLAATPSPATSNWDDILSGIAQLDEAIS